MNSVGTILKLWNKAQEVLEKLEEGAQEKLAKKLAKTSGKKGTAVKDAKQVAYPKAEAQHKRIVRGLGNLKKLATAADIKTNSDKQQAFVKTQAGTVKTMKQYCQTVRKPADEMDSGRHAKLLKQLKALTVVTIELTPGTVTAAEDAKASLEHLDKIEVGNLENELGIPIPETGEEELPDVDALLSGTEPVVSASKPTAPPRPARPAPQSSPSATTPTQPPPRPARPTPSSGRPLPTPPTPTSAKQPPSPEQVKTLKTTEASRKQKAEETAELVATTERKIAELTELADRRKRIADKDGTTGDNTWILEQSGLEATVVGLKKQLEVQKGALKGVQGLAAKSEQERADAVDAVIHGGIGKGEAVFLSSLEGKAADAAKKFDVATTEAQEVETDLARLQQPRTVGRELKKARKRLVDLEANLKWVKDEKHWYNLPKNKKAKEEAIAQATKEVEQARADLVAAENAEKSSWGVASQIAKGGNEGKWRAKSIDAMKEAAAAHVEAADNKHKAAVFTTAVARKHRDEAQGRFDQAIAGTPDGQKKVKAVAETQAAAAEAAVTFVKAKEEHELLAGVARGDMTEPALAQAAATVDEAEAEAHRREEDALEARNLLKAAQESGVQGAELAPYQQSVLAAEKRLNEQKTVVIAARKEKERLGKIAEGDAGAIKQALDQAKEANDKLKLARTGVEQAKAKGAAANVLQQFEDKLREAEAAAAKFGPVGEMAGRAKTAADVGLPARRKALAAAEKTRDDLKTDLDADRQQLAALRQKHKLSDKFDKKEKAALEEAAQKVKTQELEAQKAQAAVNLLADRIAVAKTMSQPTKGLEQKLALEKHFLDTEMEKLDQARDEEAKLYAATLEKAEAKIGNKKEQKELSDLRQKIAANEGKLKESRLAVGKLTKERDDLVRSVTDKTEKALGDARKTLKQATAANEDAGKQFQAVVDGTPALQQALAEVTDADGTLERDEGAEAEALADYAAAEAETRIAAFMEESLRNVEAETKAFDFFADLTAEDFENALRGKGVDSSAIGKKFPPLPAKPKGMSDTDYNKLVQEAEKKRAEYTEHLRVAQEALQRLLERDQVLAELGAPFEERKKAFAHIPEAFLPKKFKEELEAYRQVEELFRKEEEEKAMQKAQKEMLREAIASKLGGAYDAVAPLVDTFLDLIGKAGTLVPEDAPGADVLKMFNVVGEGVMAFIESVDLVKNDETEMLDKVLPPGGNEEERKEEIQRRQLTGESKQREMLAFMKKFIVQSASNTGTVLHMAKETGALTGTAATAAGGVVPVLGFALAAIEAAEATWDAGVQIRMAAREGIIYRDAKAAEEDQALVGSFANQYNRSTNRAVKKSVHAGAKTVQATGSAVTAAATLSGIGAGGVAAGYGVTAVGKGIELGNKAVFQAIDWAQAAKAKETMNLARAGSERAMQEVFRNHQMYATMYIALKAKEGDARAMKFCLVRGLDRKAILDSATSLALIRKELMAVVDQEDDMPTLTESIGNKWDTVCKAGKAVGGGVNFVTGGGAAKGVELVKTGVNKVMDKLLPPEPPPEIVVKTNRPTPQMFYQMQLRAQGIMEKHNGVGMDEKDVRDRNAYVAQLQKLHHELREKNVTDWPEAPLKNQGGKTAVQHIQETLAEFQKLPDKPDVEREKSLKEAMEWAKQKKTGGA